MKKKIDDHVQKNYSREELIDICENAVVPSSKWRDRDSYCAQNNVEIIYKGLKAGVDYSTNIDGSTIWVSFDEPTKDQLKDTYNHNLNIGSIDEYREEFGHDCEMFESHDSWSSGKQSGYLPTQERLDRVCGDDWY